MIELSAGSNKILRGIAVLFFLLMVAGGGRAWYVQNEIIKQYHKEIIDRLSEGGDQV